MEWCGWESIAAAMDFHKKIHSDRHRPTPVCIIACFFLIVKLFCGIFAWNMLEYVMLWCSVSCVPLCKGVRCARLCTLFFSSRCYLTCLKCITLSCDCQQKPLIATMWVCRALALCYFSLFLLILSYHKNLWLSRTFF